MGFLVMGFFSRISVVMLCLFTIAIWVVVKGIKEHNKKMIVIAIVSYIVLFVAVGWEVLTLIGSM